MMMIRARDEIILDSASGFIDFIVVIFLIGFYVFNLT